MVITDDGNEFKEVFNKYLANNKIIHRQTISGKHRENQLPISLIYQVQQDLNRKHCKHYFPIHKVDDLALAEQKFYL